MNTKIARIVTDIAMFAAMCFITGTGLLIHYRLVPGSRGGHGLTLQGLSRHEWGTYHLWAAYGLLSLVIVHLILNFAFIKNCIAARRTWIVIVLGLAGLLITSVFLLLPIQRRNNGGSEQGIRQQNGDDLRGPGMRRGRPSVSDLSR